MVSEYMLTQVMTMGLGGAMLIGTIYMVFQRLATMSARSDERFMRVMYDIEQKRQEFWASIYGKKPNGTETGGDVREQRLRRTAALNKAGYPQSCTAEGEVVTCPKCGAPLVKLGESLFICEERHTWVLEQYSPRLVGDEEERIEKTVEVGRKRRKEDTE